MHLATAPYADPDIKNPEFNPNFNRLDGKIDRRSHEGIYRVIQKIPLNIRGRTGLTGKSILIFLEFDNPPTLVPRVALIGGGGDISFLGC